MFVLATPPTIIKINVITKENIFSLDIKLLLYSLLLVLINLLIALIVTIVINTYIKYNGKVYKYKY